MIWNNKISTFCIIAEYSSNLHIISINKILMFIFTVTPVTLKNQLIQYYSTWATVDQRRRASIVYSIDHQYCHHDWSAKNRYGRIYYQISLTRFGLLPILASMSDKLVCTLIAIRSINCRHQDENNWLSDTIRFICTSHLHNLCTINEMHRLNANVIWNNNKTLTMVRIVLR